MRYDEMIAEIAEYEDYEPHLPEPERCPVCDEDTLYPCTSHEYADRDGRRGIDVTEWYCTEGCDLDELPQFNTGT